MKKLKVAYFTPLSPIKSGVADFDEMLLGQLKDDLDISIFIDDGYRPDHQALMSNFKIFRHKEFEIVHSLFDQVIYNLGNNGYHTYMYKYLKKYPGIIVLHDYNLYGFFTALGLTGKLDYRKALFKNFTFSQVLRGIIEFKILKKYGFYKLTMNAPINRDVLDGSRGVIVHSEYLKNLLLNKSWFSLPVRAIHLGIDKPKAISKKAARKRLNILNDDFVILMQGFLTRIKRVDVVMKVFNEFIKEYPTAKLYLVGEISNDSGIIKLIEYFNIKNNIVLTGYVAMDKIYNYIAASDVCVNLRYPSAGETSGTLLRMFSMGKPVLISRYAQFNEFPDEISFKVPIGKNEEETLYKYFKDLATSPEHGAVKGKAAKEYMKKHYSWKQSAAEYIEFIKQIAESKQQT